MRVPRLTKCCFRYPLKFGCRVVGWYYLVTSLVGILNGFHELAYLNDQPDYPKVANYLATIKIIFSLLDAVFSGLLLLGLYTEQPNYILTWMIAKGVLIITELPLYLLMIHFDILRKELGFYVFLLGLDIYGMLVIHGYFMEVTTINESEV